jgi:hypothetical protein
MKGFVRDIENLAIKNDEVRRVLYTAEYCQFGALALNPREEIGVGVHLERAPRCPSRPG